MSKASDARLAHSLLMNVADADAAREIMRATPEAEEYRKEQEKLTAQILKAMDSAKRVEDLVFLEMTLQNFDRSQAHTEQDQASIDKAQSDYAELVHAIDQMRTSPDEYMKANLSISSRDILKMPDVRGPAKIKGNLARLQTRAMFATEEDQKVWDARIAVANKTSSMLRTLHKNLATKFERETQGGTRKEQR
jgi:hypothetical protein